MVPNVLQYTFLMIFILYHSVLCVLYTGTVYYIGNERTSTVCVRVPYLIHSVLAAEFINF
jgi:hypothetical protein